MLLLETDVAWINVSDDLTFLTDGRFLWTSERNGWRHLYLHAADGRAIRQLTSGSFQVDRVYGTDAAETQAWVRSNRDNRRQRHIAAVTLESGALRRLDRDEGGVHDGLLSPRGDRMVDTWSALDRPPRADLVTLDDGAVRELWNTDEQLAGWDLLPIRPGTITANHGAELDSLLLQPRDFDPARRYPVVLYMYGGPHSQITQDRWGDSIHHTWRCFAEKGMAVFAVDNRGTNGRGRIFERSVHRRLGQLETADQLAAVRWLSTQSWVAGDRIAAYGGSYGGYLVLMCMIADPAALRAGIAYAPVTDWRFYDTVYTERYMDLPADNSSGYRQGSPLEKAERLEKPVLLVHGMMDNNVHVQNTLQLIGRLAEAGKPYELMIYPQTRHGVRRSVEFAPHFHRLKMDFLERHLLQ
jgi:dipeptidyl-peptidase-4